MIRSINYTPHSALPRRATPAYVVFGQKARPHELSSSLNTSEALDSQLESESEGDMEDGNREAGDAGKGDTNEEESSDARGDMGAPRDSTSNGHCSHEGSDTDFATANGDNSEEEGTGVGRQSSELCKSLATWDTELTAQTSLLRATTLSTSPPMAHPGMQQGQ